MALDRFLHLPEERRAAVLETAAALFAEHGYEGTSYNELLRAIGMGKSQAYYYFADKADFFITALAAVYEEFYHATGDLPEPTSLAEFWKQIETLHLIGFRYQAGNPIAARLSLAAVRSPIRFQYADALMNREGTTRTHHTYWVELGQKLGAVRSDLSIDLLVEMSMNQALFVDEWFAERAASACDDDMKRFAVAFTDLSRRMFQP